MTSTFNPLPIPKPKRHAPRQKSPFFPLHLSSSSAPPSLVWRHFTAYLVGKWVVVFHPGDAEMLSRSNFGKGALSKFGLAFDGRDWTPVALDSLTESVDAYMEEEEPVRSPRMDDDDDDDDELLSDAPTAPPPPEPQIWPRNDHPFVKKPQMSFRRFEKHMRWRSELLGDGDEIEDSTQELSEQRQLAQESLEADGEATSRDVEEPPNKRSRVDDGADEPFLVDHPSSASCPESSALEFNDDFLIYEDTDSEDDDEEEEIENSFRKRIPRCKNWLFSHEEDPLPLKECLLLSHEEAFFLSYGLGCLTVVSSSPLSPFTSPRSGTAPTEAKSSSSSATPSSSPSTPSSPSSRIPLPLVDLWRLFRSFDARFPSKYVAYHYYRSRGWVPRCGLKFGVDFLLYVHGPKDYHATFSLVVEELDHRLRPVDPCRESQLATSGAALSRVTEQVNKDVLFCYVIRPKVRGKLEMACSQTCPPHPDNSLSSSASKGLTMEELEALLNSPNCVKEFRVKEVLKKRWIADTERDQTKSILLSMK